MTEQNVIGSVFAILILSALLIGLRRGRRRMESQAQEVFKRQDESQKLLRDILGRQTETNRLLRELIERDRKE